VTKSDLGVLLLNKDEQRVLHGDITQVIAGFAQLEKLSKVKLKDAMPGVAEAVKRLNSLRSVLNG
jgi:hypothetical protein